MSAALALAQVGAETRTRIRSTATLVAAVALLALSFLWIPDPASGFVSLSWGTADGQRTTGVYNAAYVGTVSAVLAACFLSLIGFYLVAGSVRRDRESGVGAILAATPLSKATYLAGKLLAHVAYLHLVAGLALVSGILVFLRYGLGPFDPWAFAAPSLLLVSPGLVLTAAMAVLFDVTPGLRGRGGLVLYFFAWAFLFIAIPMETQVPGKGQPPAKRAPLFDPAGMATLANLVAASTPGGQPDSISIGIEKVEGPIRTVVWGGVRWSSDLALARLATLGLVLPPFALAVLFFDRFDPARQRPGGKRRAFLQRFRTKATAALAADAGALARPPRPLTPVVAHPATFAAVLAESRLIWDAASWIKWPLLLAALAAGVHPAAAAVFLILLAPAVSEAACREDLAGTRGLVFSQPGVPASPALWKTAAVGLFVLGLGLPGTIRASLTSPAHAAAFVTGLAFVAAFAVAAGVLTRGGKLFTGLYTALWYVAVNGRGVGPFDFCGAFGGGLGAGTRLAYVALTVALVCGALLGERLRAGRPS